MKNRKKKKEKRVGIKYLNKRKYCVGTEPSALVYIGILVTSTTTGHDGLVVSALASQAEGRSSIPSYGTSFFSHTYSLSSLSNLVTPHAQRERGKVINRGVHIYVCGQKKNLNRTLRDRLTFSNVDSRTSRRIYRLALLLRAPETLSSLSKSRISIFNAHLTLLVRKMTSHNCIGKYCHFSKLTWNLPWNGALPFADQTSRMQNWKEVNIWSSTVYSCDFRFS